MLSESELHLLQTGANHGFAQWRDYFLMFFQWLPVFDFGFFLPSGVLMFFEVVCQSPNILLVSSEAVVLGLLLKLFSLSLPVESHLAVLLPAIQI